MSLAQELLFLLTLVHTNLEVFSIFSTFLWLSQRVDGKKICEKYANSLYLCGLQPLHIVSPHLAFTNLLTRILLHLLWISKCSSSVSPYRHLSLDFVVVDYLVTSDPWWVLKKFMNFQFVQVLVVRVGMMLCSFLYFGVKSRSLMSFWTSSVLL